jgi:hypothetical protein
MAAAAVALVAVGLLTAAGLGAFSGPARAQRSDAMKVRATVQPTVAAKGAKHKPPVVYGFTKPFSLSQGVHTVALTGCPKKTHVVNATIAALHGTQAKYLTVHGEGLAAKSSGKVAGEFVDISNDSATIAAPGFPVNAIGSIVCTRSTG